jgi:hypothetical protein
MDWTARFNARVVPAVCIEVLRDWLADSDDQRHIQRAQNLSKSIEDLMSEGKWLSVEQRSDLQVRQNRHAFCRDST